MRPSISKLSSKVCRDTGDTENADVVMSELTEDAQDQDVLGSLCKPARCGPPSVPAPASAPGYRLLPQAKMELFVPSSIETSGHPQARPAKPHNHEEDSSNLNPSPGVPITAQW